MFFPALELIATTDVIKVDIHETISDVLCQMHAHNHRSIVVVNGGLHYIITTKEMIRLRMEGIAFSTSLSQIGLRLLPTLEKGNNVISALNLTNEMDEHICVCNEDGTLYGLITNSDIVSSVDPQVILDSLQIGTIFDKKFGYKGVQSFVMMDEVLAYMRDIQSDCVVVQKESKPVGIITSKDVLKFIDNDLCHTIAAESVMSSPLETLPMSASINEALEFIKARHYKRIIVVDAAGEIMGIVSQQDLISRTYLKWSKLVNEHFEQFEELTQILQNKNRHLATLAMRDQLTGISNRHMFAELYEKELSMLKRYNGKLSLVMLDLDHFKVVNDTFGHNIGDFVLKEFAQIVSTQVREADIFARWGGEEFVLLLRETMCDQAYVVSEKIRHRIESHVFGEVGSVTCSIGMTEIDATDTLESGIERADRALYEAKRSGRNQTVRCESPSQEQGE